MFADRWRTVFDTCFDSHIAVSHTRFRPAIDRLYMIHGWAQPRHVSVPKRIHTCTSLQIMERGTRLGALDYDTCSLVPIPPQT